ncbi:SDR family NAD(P)-dependent oxidoreductase [Ktedonobacter robiniae]|uniref:3-oxoacyl-ACP reductase n=1 Tax=Ktedonobacter robiniae TaxID=2778365 RepID=A0ABQ3UQX5_9CHLR|nr:glucose 1-dehydrogenase [Ktedonobacter robiniae]GHO55110.1 3-oxoacyl-ACP reductase [Ktedonobacter robiniae]
MGRLAEKVVFLTGGGGVLGRASAGLFAREGARVAVVDTLKDKAEETAQGIIASGGDAIALCTDVTDEAAVRAAVEATVQHWGHLDTIFNNAGVMPHQDESVLTLDVELMARIYAINVTGTALCCKYAIPHIKRTGGGAIVNMSSFLAVVGCIKPQDAYGASKGAIVALTHSLAVQFGRDGIRVNALCPGPIETEHVRHFFADEAARKLRLDHIPLGRFGRPEDVAELALFLASDAAGWLTGQAIVLDGGVSCNYFSVL